MVRKIPEGWVISTAHDWREHSALSAKQMGGNDGDYACFRCGHVSKTTQTDEPCSPHWEAAPCVA